MDVLWVCNGFIIDLLWMYIGFTMELLRTCYGFIMDFHWFWYVIIIGISWLMVSNIPMFSLKINFKNKQELFPVILLFVIGIISSIFLKWLAIPILFVSYIILSLLNKKKLS
jgi:phosphatidylserine synthase